MLCVHVNVNTLIFDEVKCMLRVNRCLFIISENDFARSL